VGEGEKEGSGEGDFPLKEGYNDSHIPPMPPRDENEAQAKYQGIPL